MTANNADVLETTLRAMILHDLSDVLDVVLTLKCEYEPNVMLYDVVAVRRDDQRDVIAVAYIETTTTVDISAMNADDTPNDALLVIVRDCIDPRAYAMTDNNYDDVADATYDNLVSKRDDIARVLNVDSVTIDTDIVDAFDLVFTFAVRGHIFAFVDYDVDA
jgi:hypothetical protein